MNTSKKLLAIVLILVDFLLLHYIVSSIPLRFDLTEENLYTLSDSTRDLLQKIEDPLVIDFYTSRSLAELPAWFKTFADRVEQMLEQYESAAGGTLRLRVIDPQPDTVEEEMAIAAGLHGQEIATGDRVFLGMVVSQGDTEVTFPFFNWNRENFLEYDISRTIFEAQQIAKPRLGLITSLPLQANGMPTMPGQPPQADQFLIEQLSTTFDIVSIEADRQSLPSDLDLLAVIHPKDASEALQYQIDQFALSGRPVFIAVDPSSVQEREQSRQMQMMGANMNASASSDLPALFAGWGIQYDPAKVVLDPENSIAQANYVQPAWLVFQEENLHRDLLPASDLEGVMTLEAGALTLQEGSSANWEPVLSVSEAAATVPSMMLQFSQPNTLLRDSQPIGQPVYIAGLLTGELSSAFPEGDPTADEGSEAPAEHRESGSVAVFLISDTDWLLERFSVQRVNFLGMQQIQKLNDNQALAANFMEYLGGSRDLIGIRGKGSSSRAFEVVQAMEAEAQKAYQQKLEAVEAELAQINERLAELLNQRQGQGLITATPEMEAVIQEHRAQQARLRAEQREIRRELRQGIESLGNTIGAINLLWAPIALLLFAIYFNRLRKQK